MRQGRDFFKIMFAFLWGMRDSGQGGGGLYYLVNINLISCVLKKKRYKRYYDWNLIFLLFIEQSVRSTITIKEVSTTIC